MKLWHGTSSRFLDLILEHGLLPKAALEEYGIESGEQHWKEFPSRDECVYLTDTYPLYFAASRSEYPEKMLIIETEVDEGLLEPDEDFIVQGLNQTNKLETQTIWLLKNWQGVADEDLPSGEDLTFEFCHSIIRDSISLFWGDLADDSIKGLGTVAHLGPIHETEITRYALIDMKEQAGITAISLDPSISVWNKLLLGQRYSETVRWIFGDRETIPHAFEGMEFAPGKKIEDLHHSIKEQRDGLLRASKNRKGIEVVNLR